MEAPLKNQSVAVVILAAGQGKRIHAEGKNKVMFLVNGKPLISYPMESLTMVPELQKPIIVVGYEKESIQNYLKDRAKYAEQREPLGTGDAVVSALPLIEQGTQNVIVLYGDASLFYSIDVIHRLIQKHCETKADMTLITTKQENPTGYGRILRDDSGKMIGIVEEKNATDEEKKITEINTGSGIYSLSFLKKFLPRIKKNIVSGEYYLTDIVMLGVEAKRNIETLYIDDQLVGMGVNTLQQLQEVEAEVLKRKSTI